MDKRYKEIHFYESDDEFYKTMQKLKTIQKSFYLGYCETITAIQMEEPIIHTIQMACLTDHIELFNLGYRIFIHEPDGTVYEIKFGTENERTNRELKLGHNIFKMWLSGEFERDV